MIRRSNYYGEVQVRATVCDMTGAGVVYVPFNWWRETTRNGSSANALTADGLRRRRIGSNAFDAYVEIQKAGERARPHITARSVSLVASNQTIAKGWFVYILECSDGTLYTGVTTAITRRVEEHNAGVGAKYTRQRRPVHVVYSEQAPDRSCAQKREAAIKRLPLALKRDLVERGSPPGKLEPACLSCISTR